MNHSGNNPNKLSHSEQARINGAKSKGPMTPEGKAISSRNAVKHGFAAASTTVLTIEDKAEWEIHLEDARQQYNPQSRFEQVLVDELASIKWRQIRLVRIETHLLELQLSMQNEAIEKSYPDLDGNRDFHLILAWQGVARHPQKPTPADGVLPPEGHDITSIELVRRYIVTLSRQYNNVVSNLRQCQKDTAAKAAPVPAPAAAPGASEVPAQDEPRTPEEPPQKAIKQPALVPFAAPPLAPSAPKNASQPQPFVPDTPEVAA